VSSPRSAAERVAATLRGQIVDGQLRSGTRLTEEALTGQLEVSRNTVREAFALLRAERIVVHERHRGVFVATPTVEDVTDLYVVRRLIEPGALSGGLAQDAPPLRAIVTAGQVAAEQEQWEEVASANQRFHRGVVALAGSRRLSETFEGLLAEMRLIFYQRGDQRFHGHYLRLNHEICALLEAGRAGDAAARLTAYLLEAEAELVAALTRPTPANPGMVAQPRARHAAHVRGEVSAASASG
jgi:DNA-binding GntR family transcriptional regulator